MFKKNKSEKCIFCILGFIACLSLSLFLQYVYQYIRFLIETAVYPEICTIGTGI